MTQEKQDQGEEEKKELSEREPPVESTEPTPEEQDPPEPDVSEEEPEPEGAEEGPEEAPSELEGPKEPEEELRVEEIEGPESVPGDREVLIQLLLKAGMSEEEANRVVEHGEVEGNIQRIIMGSINVPDAKLEIPEVADEEGPLIGFSRIIERLHNLEAMVFQLEFNLSALLTDLFSRMREHAIELRENISEHLASRLKMRLFKNFVAESYREVVDAEFDLAERRILADWLGEISFAFNEYRDHIRVAGGSLRGTVLESKDVVRAFLESLEKEINSLRGEMRELSARMENKENELELVRRQLETTRGLGDLDREIRVKEGEIEYLLDQVRTLESDRRNLEGQIQSLETEQETWKRSEASLTRQRETITQQTARIEELERRLEESRAEREMMSDLRQQAARREALEELLNEKEEELKEQRLLLSQHEAAIAEAQAKFETKQKELEGTTRQLTEKRDEIKELRTQMARVVYADETIRVQRSELESQADLVTDLAGKFGALEAELDARNEEIQTLKTETNELRENLSGLTKLKRELELAKEQLLTEKERVEHEQLKYVELQREIERLEQEREELIPGMTRSKLEQIIQEHSTMEKTFRHFEYISKSEPRLEILFLLLKQPPQATLSADEIIKTVGIVPALVRRYLNELERMGIIKQEDDKVLLLG